MKLYPLSYHPSGPPSPKN